MTTERIDIARAMPLLDIEVSRAGDGRTVTAYAATFDDPYPVRDQWGDYYEVIDPAAFNRAISQGTAMRAVPLFNHGLTVHGTPSERYSMPLGVTLDVRPDSRGLVTVWRAAKTELADEVLELIRAGAVSAQSFRGTVYKSAAPQQRNGRTVLRRTELGLKEYGPGILAVNPSASFVAIRSNVLDRIDVDSLTEEERAALIAALAGTPQNTVDPPSPEQTPDADPPAVATAPDVTGPSLDMVMLAAARARARRDI